MRKLVLPAVALASVVFLSGCGFLPGSDAVRGPEPYNESAADQVMKAVNSGMPYVVGGGSPDGATDPQDTGTLGFDQVGLIAFAYGTGPKMYLGDSLEEMYNASEPVEPDDDGGAVFPVEGDLVFSADHQWVGIIVEADRDQDVFRMAVADRDQGVIEVDWNRELYSEVREVHNGLKNSLRADYKRWKDAREGGSDTHGSAGELEDQNDPNRSNVDELSIPDGK